MIRIFTTAVIGLNVQIVEVEVDIRGAMPKFEIAGLAGKAVQESKERVISAIRNSGFEFPSKNIIVNLAPADLPKSGTSYDLPIAIGILLASGQVKSAKFESSTKIILGELSLNGEVRHVNGILPVADFLYSKKLNLKNNLNNEYLISESNDLESVESNNELIKEINSEIIHLNQSLKINYSNAELFVPEVDSTEAGLVKEINSYGINSLKEFADFLNELQDIPKIEFNAELDQDEVFEYDFSVVKGQKNAKRALEVAAAGGHNILLSGTPGSGKSLLAKSLPSILPKLTFQEALEVTRIYSVAGLLPKDKPIISTRPFRHPHHTASDVSLVGGGAYPKPGEISLAHRGLLFLDEFPEFSQTALESLRQPLEDRIVTISRATGSITFPANFMLIAAMNPCKCGWHGDPEKPCVCTSVDVSRYQKKISGPILDRIDLQVWVPRVNFDKLTQVEPEESSKDIKERVQKAREVQLERYKKNNLKIVQNSELPQKDLEKFIKIDETAKALLKNAVEKLNLSARSYFRLLKVARTIADLELVDSISSSHVAEALSYRLQQE